MTNRTRIETANETVNTAFQMVTIALVGVFTLAQTVLFLTTAMV